LIPRWIVLIESWGDVDAFRVQCRAMLADGTFAAAIEAPTCGVYALQNLRVKAR
jgi:hypothetical protein